jgi:outer membrane receptor protein involved in Fe transport
MAGVAVALAEEPPAFVALTPPEAERFGGGEYVGAGGYIPIPARLYPGTVRVWDGDELRRRGYLYLGQALAEEAGCYVEYVPGRAGPTMVPRLRGATGREVLLLIDGVPFNQLPSGWADLKGFPLESIARVEVIAGPASYRWGSGALAGVVSVETMHGPREAAKALISASDGAADTERYRFNFGMTTHNADIFVGGNRVLFLEPNTRAYHNRGTQANGDGRLAYRWGDVGEVDFTAGHYSGMEAVIPAWNWDTAEELAAVQKDSDNRLRFDARRRWGRLEGRAAAYYHDGRHQFDDDDARVSTSAAAEEERGTVTATWRHGAASGLTGEGSGGRLRFRDSGAARAYFSARLLEEFIPVSSVYAAAGASYDGVSSGSGALSPHVAASYAAFGKLKFYGRYSGGVRFPSPVEWERDERLGIERGFEGGVRYYAARYAEFGAAYFGSRGRGLYLDGEGVWTDELRRVGVEASAAGYIPPGVEWAGSFCDARAERENGAPVWYYPRRRGTGRVGYVVKFFNGDLRTRLDVLGEYVGGRPCDVSAELNPPDVDKRPTPNPYPDGLPAYWQLGAHFSLTIISFQGYVNVENLNRAPAYVIRPGYTLPRRVRTYVGFNWTLFD